MSFTRLFKLFSILLTFTIFISSPNQVKAASITWVGVSGAWETGANWSGGSPPGADDDVTIDANVTVTINASTTINSLTLGNVGGTTTPTLNFGYDAITSGALIIDDGDLNTYSGSNITHTAGTADNGGTIVGRVYLHANTGNISISGTINADSKGYPGGINHADGSGPGWGDGAPLRGGGGAGHGESGGRSNDTQYGGFGGVKYGSLVNPVEMGSGGGGGTSQGGYGGGSIKLIASSGVIINGYVTANGGSGISGGDASGGGSGGSIQISASNISGSGTISANGGNGGTGGTYHGGGAAGGRIATYYTSSTSFDGQFSVSYGTGGGTALNGGYGTAFIEDTSVSDLIVPTINSIWYYNERNSWNFRNITINADIEFKSTGASLMEIGSTGVTTIDENTTITLSGSNTTDSDGRGVYLNLSGNVTIPATSVITSNSKGYSGGASGHGSGSGLGKGYGAGIRGGGGAGYGSDGGRANDGQYGGWGGVDYGSLDNPLDLGSGGGGASSAGGNGGGAIKITTTGTLTVSGTISANGGNGQGGTYGSGGGSGGSIYLSAPTIGGTGTVTANGGNGGTGGSYHGGGGAGGRIVFYFTSSNTFSGTLSTTYGQGAVNAIDGGYGTAFYENSSTKDLTIPILNATWYSTDRNTWNFNNINFNANINLSSAGANLFTINSTGITTFSDNITVTLTGSYTSDSDGKGVFLNLSNDILIPANTTISALGTGYSGGSTQSHGTGTGKGYRAGQRGGGGAGYGGAGGRASDSQYGGFGGIAYGSSNNPLDLGSGGAGSDSSTGGSGGGAIKIATNGTITVNGSINANGGNGGIIIDGGGGGSGGSIYLLANTIAGNGSITANGGDGGDASRYDGGGAAGGRIAIFYGTSNNFSGTSSVTQGVGPGNAIDGEIGTNLLTAIPASASNLSQYQSDGTTLIQTGSNSNETSVVIKLDMNHADTSATLTPEVEVRQVGTAFTNTATHTGSGVAYSGTTVTGSVTVTGLSDLTDYHWQARVCDASANCSSWVSYGGNSESVADFSVLLNLSPNNPSSLGPSSLTSGSYTSDSTPTFNFTLTDSDAGEQIKYQIQIDDNSDFSSPTVDYTSSFAAEGSRSFTVGQLAGSGSYSSGSSGQSLSAGNYYWRVKAIDDDAAESSYVTANSGAIAFKLDATNPANFALESPSNNSNIKDTRPSFKWKSSSDSLSGLSHYTFSVDNGDNSGGIIIDNIPTSSSDTINTNKYTIEYSGFNDSDDNNNYITLTTKSSSEWSGSNDGLLREGKRTWRVSAVDSAGNINTQEATIYVDNSPPSLSSLAIYKDLYNQLVIEGYATDTKSGSNPSQSDYIRSNPDKVIIDVYVEKGKRYDLVSSAIINLDSICTYDAESLTSSCAFRKLFEDKFRPGTYLVSVTALDKATNTTTREQLISYSDLQVIDPSPTPSLRVSPSPSPTLEESLSYIAIIESTPSSESTDSGITSVTEVAKDTGGGLILGISDAFEDVVYVIESTINTVASTIKSLPETIEAIGDRIEAVYVAIVPSERTTISNVQITSVTSNSAIVTWETNHPATSKVNYGLSTSFELGDTYDPRPRESHSITLTELPSGSLIYFELISEGKTTVYDAYHTFNTTESEEGEVFQNLNEPEFNVIEGQPKYDNGYVKGTSTRKTTLGKIIYIISRTLTYVILAIGLYYLAKWIKSKRNEKTTLRHFKPRKNRRVKRVKLN